MRDKLFVGRVVVMATSSASALSSLQRQAAPGYRTDPPLERAGKYFEATGRSLEHGVPQRPSFRVYISSITLLFKARCRSVVLPIKDHSREASLTAASSPLGSGVSV